MRNVVHGADSPELVFLGVAVTCGLEKVVLPFIDRGTPIEYELVRAIYTVEKQKRKRVGWWRPTLPFSAASACRVRRRRGRSLTT